MNIDLKEIEKDDTYIVRARYEYRDPITNEVSVFHQQGAVTNKQKDELRLYNIDAKELMRASVKKELTTRTEKAYFDSIKKYARDNHQEIDFEVKDDLMSGMHNLYKPLEDIVFKSSEPILLASQLMGSIFKFSCRDDDWKGDSLSETLYKHEFNIHINEYFEDSDVLKKRHDIEGIIDYDKCATDFDVLIFNRMKVESSLIINYKIENYTKFMVCVQRGARG